MTAKDDVGCDELVLTDPRAMRALAHPVRQRLLDLLDTSDALTATEAAREIGITASAMSYHLRALEKWGIVERAAAGQDGRERPWRLTTRSLAIRPEGDARSARRAFMTSYVDRLIGALERADGSHTKGWVSASTLHLTEDEAQQVDDAVQAVLEPYGRRRADSAETPQDARPYNVFYVAVREPGEEAGTES